jgi:tRNA dimethylallyltransferase
LIDVVDPNAAFSVADFVALAEDAIRGILARGKAPLVLGGTGFYLKALAEGIPTVPPANPTTQAELWRQFEAKGLGPLEHELRAVSPVDGERAGRNPRRVIRALEIIRLTGRPPSSFPYSKPAFSFVKLVLVPTLAALEPRIVTRVEEMFARGLVAEVKSLKRRFPNCLTATQAIGYKEVVAHFDGRATLNETKAAVVLATRQYARRQRTWFGREPGVRRIEALALDAEPEVSRWLDGVYGRV